MGSPGIAEQILLAFWQHEMRDTRGRWTHGESLPGAAGPESHAYRGRFAGEDVYRPSMTPAAGHEALNRPGRPEGVAAGTAADPIDVRGDMKRAVELMAAGQHVRLNGVHEVPGLMDEINRQGDAEMKRTGAEPKWDLANISVKGTRLFNEQTIGTPRQDMPQLSGPAQPGSEAAVLAGGANRFIELDPEFRRQLHTDGIQVTNEQVPVSELRATQTQLTATSVAGIYRAARAGNPKVLHMLSEPLWATRENYILDGHHRQAADAALKIANGQWPSSQVEVQRIDLPVHLAVEYAKRFALGMGVGGRGLGNTKLVEGAGIAEQILLLAWHDAWMHEARGPGGKWIKGTGGAEPSLGSAFHKIGKVAGEAFPGFAPGAQQVFDQPHPGVHSTLPRGFASEEQVRAATAEIQAGLDRQAKYVPHIAAGQDVEIRQHIPDANELTFGVTLANGDIIDIAPIAADALNGGHSKEELAAEIKKQWWVPSDPGVSLADRTVSHEVGHVVADHIDPAEMDAMWPELAKIMGIPPPGRTLDPVTRQWRTDPSWTVGYAEEITPHISEYSTTNFAEMQAELWCEYTTSSHPRPAAKFYGDWAMAHVQDRQVVMRDTGYEEGSIDRPPDWVTQQEPVRARATTLKRGDWIKFGRLGIGPFMMEVTSVRHRGKRVHIVVRDPNGPAIYEDDAKPNAGVLVVRKDKATVRAPRPRPAPAPPAVPAPAAGRHYGDVSMVLPGMIPPPAQAQAAIAEIQHSLDLQSRFIPKIAGHQVIRIEKPEGYEGNKGVMGVTLTQGGDQIEVSPNVSNVLTGGWSDREKKRVEARGWWTPSDPQYNLADTTVAHEMGHVVVDRIPQQALNDSWAGLAKVLGVKPPDTFKDPISGRQTPDPGSWVIEHEDTIKRQVSAYAVTDPLELEAELWKEYTMSSHPRPPAKWWGDYIMSHLKKRWQEAA